YHTLDGKTLFVAVPHPGTDGTQNYPGFARASTIRGPRHAWPDFDPATALGCSDYQGQQRHNRQLTAQCADAVTLFGGAISQCSKEGA
ncbi:MAG: hypothetical protein WBM40_07970, partial [Thiohalocapsa sp.]